MHIEPYRTDELAFAWSSRVYVRVQTWRGNPSAALPDLSTQEIHELLQPYSIHVLECVPTETDARFLVSLAVGESVSAAVSKLKGRLSKWLGQRAEFNQPDRRLAGGYFAATTGTSTATEVLGYLERQSQHHGYDSRVRPPVFVESYPIDDAAESILATDHAETRLRYHICLATWYRQGVFGEAAGKRIADAWRGAQSKFGGALEKVSFVPDHVHVAVRLHPASAPSEVVTSLMNISQDLMWKEFAVDVIRAKAERLWQPSAYVGSFGDLRSAAVSAYLRNCEDKEGNAGG